MKVVLVNGSPNRSGCTDRALKEVEKELNREGIETETFWIGNKPIRGCIACGRCSELGHCVFQDRVTEFTDRIEEFDGYVFGSPVYYSGINGSMMSFMDRVCFSTSRDGSNPLMYKPAASVVSARRAGTTSALDQLNKYLMYSQSVVIASQYWAMVHGNTPEQVEQDLEGLQIMRTLGKNMAWFLKLKEAGEKAGVERPQAEPRMGTNFIR